MHEFTQSIAIDAPADEAFAWLARPAAFERLIPPWERVRLRKPLPALEAGAEMHFTVRAGPAWIDWVARIRDFEPGRMFVDEQVRGPFREWTHAHRVEPDPENGARCTLVDDVRYRLPAGTGLVAAKAVRRRLDRGFSYRHERTRRDIERHRAAGAAAPRTIAVTGATGFVGTPLVAFLRAGGHEVRRVTRSPREAGDIGWDPARGEIDRDGLDGVDVVIHLAGETIAQRWTDAAKGRIRDSRVQGTDLLARTLAAMPRRPAVLVSVSGIGYYGDTGDQEVDESAEPGDGFLADVCRAWEDAAAPARDAGLRVVHPRMGAVLGLNDGALEQMRVPFSLGLGGPVGPARQFFAWVALDNAVGALHWLAMHESADGPVNVVAPHRVRNHEFVRTLGRVLRRPTWLPLPSVAVRALFGQMGVEMLLQGQCARSDRLHALGFVPRTPQLREALAFELGRKG